MVQPNLTMLISCKPTWDSHYCNKIFKQKLPLLTQKLQWQVLPQQQDQQELEQLVIPQGSNLAYSTSRMSKKNYCWYPCSLKEPSLNLHIHSIRPQRMLPETDNHKSIISWFLGGRGEISTTALHWRHLLFGKLNGEFWTSIERLGERQCLKSTAFFAP